MGIAISTGAAIAQEIADITVSSEDLMALVTLRQLSCALMARIHRNYRFIIGFNCSLIGLGLIGILPPHHQRPAAQYVNPWHQHEEHDESAVIKRKLFPGRVFVKPGREIFDWALPFSFSSSGRSEGKASKSECPFHMTHQIIVGTGPKDPLPALASLQTNPEKIRAFRTSGDRNDLAGRPVQQIPGCKELVAVAIQEKNHMKLPQRNNPWHLGI